MAFDVQDFRDLVRLLEEHPEWRADLRRLVLTEELLGLPALVRELAEAQRRTEEQLGELAQAQRRTEERLGELAQAQRRTEDELRALARAQDALRDQLGRARGDLLEIRYREHAGGYFGRLLRRVRVVGPEELDDLLEEGVAGGAIDEDAAQDVRLADLIVRGRRPGEERDTYVVVEVSAGIGPDDVGRAARRASHLRRLRPTLTAVAGEWVTPEAEARAVAGGVWRVLDGRVLPPSD